jgi:CrcB protein
MKPDGLIPLLLVGSGGFVGSALRYAMSGWVQRIDPDGAFPFGTLAVNVAGCLAIGLLGGLAEARSALSPEVRLLVLIGVLGGFTTFSTFGWETVALLREGAWVPASVNVATSLMLGLFAVWLGYALGSAR